MQTVIGTNARLLGKVMADSGYVSVTDSDLPIEDYPDKESAFREILDERQDTVGVVARAGGHQPGDDFYPVIGHYDGDVLSFVTIVLDREPANMILEDPENLQKFVSEWWNRRESDES